MPFISQPLDMPHCHWRIFENQCIRIKNNDDWYKAELLESGLWLCIQKNGKSRKNAQGKFPNDFIVRIYDIEKGQYICQPHYTRSNGDPRRYKGLIPDLYDKLLTDRQSTELLIDVLIQVAREAEPRNLDLHTFQHLPGRPIDEILLTFKWLLAQEGVNYPIDRGKAGRLYTLNRIHEMKDGMRDGKHINIDEIVQRCQTKGQELPPISGVDFQRITSYILS